jgi:hypothetical protein
MAEEAERWSGLETARLIRTAEDNLFLQNKPLGKAAILLKNAGNRGLKKRLPSVPETPPDPAPRRKSDYEKKTEKVVTCRKGNPPGGKNGNTGLPGRS